MRQLDGAVERMICDERDVYLMGEQLCRPQYNQIYNESPVYIFLQIRIEKAETLL